jgi:glycosyltransferase involved in cell wall biosynthesis
MPDSTAAKIEGYVETLSAQRVTGWGWEIGSDRALVLQILLGDRVVGETVADRFRKDLQDGKKGNGKHAFEYIFPAPVAEFNRVGHVRVRVRGTDRVLTPLDALLKRLAGLTKQADATPKPPAPPPSGPAVSARDPATPVPIPAIAPETLIPPPPKPLPRAANPATPSASAAGANQAGARPPNAASLPAAPTTAAAMAKPPHVAVPSKPVQAGPAGSAAVAPPAPGSTGAPDVPRPIANPATLIVTGPSTEQEAERAEWLASLSRSTSDRGDAILVVLAGRPPLPKPGLTLRHLPIGNLGLLVEGALATAQAQPCGTVIVSPPSLPALIAGALISRRHDAKLIVDFGDTDPSTWPPAGLDEQRLAQAIGGGAEAAACAPALAAEADALLVANPTQRRAAGGMLVRQGRDETLFDPHGYARAQMRAAFGYGDDDRIVMLHGALTLQDGVLEIAEALQQIDDPRLTLCLVGAIADPKIEQRLAACPKARIAVHPPQPARRIASMVAMADCVAVLQSATQPQVQYCVPPRLIDALAMNVPVIATPAPPLMDIAAAGAVTLVTDSAQLHAVLRQVAAKPSPAGAGARAVYLADFSARVNAARLELAVDTAIKRTPDERPALTALFRALETQLSIKLPFMVPSRFSPARPDRGSRAPLPRPERPRQLVFLANDNESDLFGRRADQIAAALLGSGKVARILHLDAKLEVAELERQAAAGPEGEAHRGSLIYANTVRRVLGLADTPNFLRRTFLHRGGRSTERMMGRELPPASDYLNFVRRIVRENDFGPAPLLWVCAGAPGYEGIRQAIEPSLVIADFSDVSPTAGTAESDRSAAALLADADLVLASGPAVRDRLAADRPDCLIVADAPGTDATAGAAWWDDAINKLWPLVEHTA